MGWLGNEFFHGIELDFLRFIMAIAKDFTRNLIASNIQGLIMTVRSNPKAILFISSLMLMIFLRSF